jgi:3-oxoadipate enol-lactonase
MTLHREVRGDGPPVLLVHAGIADSRMWEPLAERLVAAGHRVVTCDLRGFGRTPLPERRVSNAADLVYLLDELGIARTAVVGASFGGRVALELALRVPERVTALALLGSSLDEFDASDELDAFDADETAAVEAGDADAATELNVRMWLDRPGRAGVDPAVRDLVRAMLRRAIELQDGVEAALVVVGEDDVEDFHRLAELLARELPGADGVVRIAGAAHLPALERPAEVADVLVPFLSRHAPA